MHLKVKNITPSPYILPHEKGVILPGEVRELYSTYMDKAEAEQIAYRGKYIEGVLDIVQDDFHVFTQPPPPTGGNMGQILYSYRGPMWFPGTFGDPSGNWAISPVSPKAVPFFEIAYARSKAVVNLNHWVYVNDVMVWTFPKSLSDFRYVVPIELKVGDKIRIHSNSTSGSQSDQDGQVSILI